MTIDERIQTQDAPTVRVLARKDPPRYRWTTTCWHCGAECHPAEAYCTKCDMNWPGARETNS